MEANKLYIKGEQLIKKRFHVPKMYVFTFFVCSTYALNNNWVFSLLFQVKKLRFEKLWFDNVRNYNMTNYRMKYCRRLSSPRVENHHNFRQKKSEEEKERKKRIYFGHAEWILIIFFGRFDTVWEHSLFRMWQKQRTYRSWWYESSCSWASMHSDNGGVGVWKWEILVSIQFILILPFLWIEYLSSSAFSE